MKPLLEVKNLRKSYKNGVLAVDGIDLQIHAGSIYALVGPNGAGKT
ncbi:MAG: ABC transporter ATP-binding protein, partial [Thermotogae bacterium]